MSYHGIGPQRQGLQVPCAGIDRSDPATWLNDRWPPTFGDTSGIINCLEVCSMPAGQPDIRQGLLKMLSPL